MTLADFTSPGLIIPQLKGKESASVIQELSHALQRQNCIPQLLPFYQSALNREFLVSTETEAGMAFPHARVPGLREPLFAFGRSAVPLAWRPSGVRSVRLVFLMAVPETDATQYLLLISGLVRLAKNAALLEKLYAAEDTFQIADVLRQVELRTGATADTARKSVDVIS